MSGRVIPGVSLAGVSMLTGEDVEDAMAGEAEGGLLIGDREEMELVVDVDLVAVAVCWLSLEGGR